MVVLLAEMEHYFLGDVFGGMLLDFMPVYVFLMVVQLIRDLDNARKAQNVHEAKEHVRVSVVFN